MIQNYLKEPNEDAALNLFDELAAEFSTADKTGPSVDEKFAKLIRKLVTNQLPKAKIEELLQKYPRPGNCDLLVAPKVNKVVWQQLKQGTRTADSSMQKCQKLFIPSIYAIIQPCEKTTGEVKTTLIHALVLALSGNKKLNLKRRNLLRPDPNTQYASLV